MTSPTSPRVSLVLRCHDLGRALEDVMSPILAQTWQDFEVLIVDDGSTDPETRQLLAAAPWPRTRVIHMEHRGPVRAWNCGIDHALGAYVTILDPRCQLSGTFLERAVARLDADNGVAFLSGWVQARASGDGVWRPERCDFPALLHECTVAPAALVRRPALTAVGGFDSTVPIPGCEAWDLWITLVEQGFHGLILAEPLFISECEWPPDDGVPDSQRLDHLRRLIAKHEVSYQQNLFELLLMRESLSCDLLKMTYELDRTLDGWLAPLVARRREELARLERKLEEARADRETRASVDALHRELARLRDKAQDSERRLSAAISEVAALRRSLSWRLTAPLRGGLDLLRAVRLFRRKRAAGGESTRPLPPAP
ncbi:MAG: glycosyltransferase [Acidobacteriota bacterium]